jgi:hypothetical protein
MQALTFPTFVAPLTRGLMRTTGLLLPALLIGTAAYAARDADDPAYERYRCEELGYSSACKASPSLPSMRIEERLEPGSYARYLMYLGQSEDDALASAALIGEFPVKRIVRVTERQLSGEEKHQRFLAGTPQTARTEQTLSATVVKPASEERQAGARAFGSMD